MVAGNDKKQSLTIAVFRAVYIFCKCMLKIVKKRRDPHPICRRSVEKRFPRTLTATPPRYPLNTVIMARAAAVAQRLRAFAPQAECYELESKLAKSGRDSSTVDRKIGSGAKLGKSPLKSGKLLMIKFSKI